MASRFLCMRSATNPSSPRSPAPRSPDHPSPGSPARPFLACWGGITRDVGNHPIFSSPAPAPRLSPNSTQGHPSPGPRHARFSRDGVECHPRKAIGATLLITSNSIIPGSRARCFRVLGWKVTQKAKESAEGRSPKTQNATVPRCDKFIFHLWSAGALACGTHVAQSPAPAFLKGTPCCTMPADGAGTAFRPVTSQA